MIAFQMAVDFPAAVKSLTIVNSVPAVVLKKRRERALIGLRYQVVRWFGMRAMGRIIARSLFPDRGQKELRKTFIDRVAENDPRAYLDSVRAMDGWTVVDRLSGIRCPTLILTSDQDYTPVEAKHEYAVRIPGAVVTVLKNSRHAAPIDQTAEFNRIVLEFLNGVRQ